MILIYSPEGADPQRWQFTLNTLMSVEAEALERQTGWAFPAEFGQQIAKGSMIARKSLLWIFLKRTDAPLLYKQIDVPSGAIRIDFDRDELIAFRDAVDADQDMSEAQKETTRNALDELIAKEPEQTPKVTGLAAVSNA